MPTTTPRQNTTSRPSKQQTKRVTDEDVAYELDDEEWKDEEVESRKTKRQNGRKSSSYKNKEREFNTHQSNHFNDCRFEGNLGRDVEISVTPNGTAIGKFSLGVWQGKEKETMWINCIAWDDLAEWASENIGKGTHVRVAGRMNQRKYEGKYYHDLNCDYIEEVSR